MEKALVKYGDLITTTLDETSSQKLLKILTGKHEIPARTVQLKNIGTQVLVPGEYYDEYNEIVCNIFNLGYDDFINDIPSRAFGVGVYDGNKILEYLDGETYSISSVYDFGKKPDRVFKLA